VPERHYGARQHLERYRVVIWSASSAVPVPRARKVGALRPVLTDCLRDSLKDWYQKSSPWAQAWDNPREPGDQRRTDKSTAGSSKDRS
jgi:hypothetical protein